jgi:hypothetical protein
MGHPMLYPCADTAIDIATFKPFVKWLETDSMEIRKFPNTSPLHVKYERKS